MGSGLSTVEAMACGAPVVAGNRGALLEVCGDAVLHVDPTSDGELTDAVRQLLDHAALREKLRTRGFERAGRFSWARSAEEMVRVYEAVAGSA